MPLIKTLVGSTMGGQVGGEESGRAGLSFLLLRPEVQVAGGWESGWCLSQPHPQASFSGPGRFVSPDQKYSMDNTPHTPTPFKNALEKYGPLKPLVRGVVPVRWGLPGSSSPVRFPEPSPSEISLESPSSPFSIL